MLLSTAAVGYGRCAVETRRMQPPSLRRIRPVEVIFQEAPIDVMDFPVAQPPKRMCHAVLAGCSKRRAPKIGGTS